MSHDVDEPTRGRDFPIKLCFKRGLFYAQIEHPASECPLEVALHGIRSHEEATRAVLLLRMEPDTGVLPSL